MRTFPELVGRASERAQLSQILTEPAERAVVVSGEPGVGKTVLLQDLCARALAEEWRVVRVLGVEVEESYVLGGLNQIVCGLADSEVQLDDRDRAVLAPVIGGDPVSPVAVLPLVGTVLKLLTLAAQTQPLLLVVDDVQWLDSVSARVLDAVGRRLSVPRLRAVVGRRRPYASVFSGAGWTEIMLAPLNAEDSELVLNRAAAQLSPATRTAILAAAAGNPLALAELPRCAESFDGYRCPSELPLSESLVTVFGARLEHLDARTRAALLRAALDGSADAAWGGGRARYVMRNVHPAVEAGLVVPVGSGELHFRHPLVRAAIIHHANPAERQDAHRELAELYADVLVRRAAHLAAAITEPDSEVAELLFRAAKLSERRGGLRVAADWLRRAAEMSPDPTRRAALLSDAVFVAARAGELDHSQEYLDGDFSGAPQWAPSALAAAYRKFHRDGDVLSTHRLLLDTLASADTLDDKTLNRIVHLLLSITSYAGNALQWEQTNAALGAAEARVNPSVLMYRTGTDLAAVAGVLRARLSIYAQSLPRLHHRQVMLLAFPAYCIDALADFRVRLHMAFTELSEHGASIDAIEAGRVVMLDLIAAGHWAQAEQVGVVCLEMARQPQGSRLREHQFLADLGALAAARGDLPTARRYATEVIAWSAPRGLRRLRDAADRVAIRIGLAEADYETAYHAAVRISDTGQHPRHHLHEAVGDILDLVEAAVNSGRVSQARECAARELDRGLAEISPRAQAVSLAIAAMTTSEADASELFSRARNHEGIAGFPFEAARVALAQGRWLRRQSRHCEAHSALEWAADSFDRLGSEPWAVHARHELRAAGADVRRTHVALSTQERRIAEFAAAGQTTRQIAERLFLSARTVDTHLYRVFRKFGISSRRELGAALAEGHPSGGRG